MEQETKSDKNSKNPIELLDKLASKDMLIYLSDKCPKILTMDISEYGKLPLQEKKTYVWNKLSSEFNLHPILKNYVLTLVESMKFTKATLYLIEDNIKMIDELAKLKDKNKKLFSKLDCFLDIQTDPKEPRFSINEIDGIIYYEMKKFIGNYAKSQTDYLNESIKAENKMNIDLIRRHYEIKKIDLENKFKIKEENILNDINRKTKAYIDDKLLKIKNKIKKIRKYAFKRKFGAILGTTGQINKIMSKIKFEEINLKNTTEENKIKLNNLDNNINIIKESEEINLNDIIEQPIQLNKSKNFIEKDIFFKDKDREKQSLNLVNKVNNNIINYFKNNLDPNIYQNMILNMNNTFDNNEHNNAIKSQNFHEKISCRADSPD